MRRELSFVGSCYLALLAAGCGSDAPDRYPLTGNVSFQGVPVPDGSIRFVPDGNAQQQEGAVIRDGKYSAMLTPGKKQVVIEAFRPKETQPDVPQRPGGMPLRGGAVDTVMYIPEQYNTKTTLTVDAGPSTSTQNFELK